MLSELYLWYFFPATLTFRGSEDGPHIPDADDRLLKLRIDELQENFITCCVHTETICYPV